MSSDILPSEVGRLEDDYEDCKENIRPLSDNIPHSNRRRPLQEQDSLLDEDRRRVSSTFGPYP